MATAQLTPVGVGIRNVLIATDFSQFSDRALRFGLELARSFGAEAYVVSVVQQDAVMLAGPEAYVAARDATYRDLLGLKEELKKKHSYLEGEDYHLLMLEGEAAQAVLDFARERKIDLIVVGTHGRGGLGKMVLGSVAERIFRQSPVPVLTIGPHVHGAPGKGAPGNILVPVDFGPATGAAARYAASMAKEHNAKLTMLHVIERWPAEAQGGPRAGAARVEGADCGADQQGSGRTALQLPD